MNYIKDAAMAMNVPKLFLRGGKELALATGYTSRAKHKEWREKGMPYGMDGKQHVYPVDGVEKFLRELYGIDIKVEPRASFRGRPKK